MSMALSESEEENLEELGNEGDDDPDVDVEDEGLDIAPDDATEDRGDVCARIDILSLH